MGVAVPSELLCNWFGSDELVDSLTLSAIVLDGWDVVMGDKAMLVALRDRGPAANAIPSHASFDVAVDKVVVDTGFECEMPYVDGEAVKCS